MKSGNKGFELIKEFGDCQLIAYQDSVGIWTIGYGHTKGVRKGDVITQDQANQFLIEDLADVENAVNRLVTVEINQDMFDALVSFTFNIGIEGFSKSTLLRLLNQGQYSGAAEQFEKWTFVGGKRMDSLVKRREAEHRLFRLVSELRS